MAIGSLKDLYLDELNDLYDAEMQIRSQPFRRLAEAAHHPELRATLSRQSEESRLHLERLELIFTHWGEQRRQQHCAGLNGIVQEADESRACCDDSRHARRRHHRRGSANRTLRPGGLRQRSDRARDG
jgi:ferritin-like metal-binding protein YciE